MATCKSEQISKLYAEIKSGNIDSLQQLLVITASKPDDADADNHLLRQTHLNSNSLHVAVQLSKSAKLVEGIFNQCGSSKSLALLMQQNMNGDTPLHIAARVQGSTEIVSLFIDHARNSQSIIHHYNRTRDDDIDVEKGIILVAAAAAAAEKYATNDIVEQLVRIANKENNTALHEALKYQADSGIPQLLISADPGFEYLANDSDESPLYLAVNFGTLDLVELMLKTRPSQSCGAPGKGLGRTMLHALALQNHYLTGDYSHVVYQLRHIVKEVDKDGRTSLHYAAYFDNSEFVDAVMEVDPSVCYMSDKDGRTALHQAAAKGNIYVLRKMIQDCMDCLEVLDNEGRNFLHVAAQKGESCVLDYVLNEISSDLVVDTIIRRKDKNGKTPCELAPEFSWILKDNTRVKQRLIIDAFMALDNAVQIEEDVKAAADEKARREAVAKEEDKVMRKQMDYYNQTLVVVSALIATVAFAANFTLPGGFNSDGPHKGMAVLANKPSFIGFIVSNSMAMVLSALAILIQFVGKIVPLLRGDLDYKSDRLLVTAIACNLLAILAMMVAFVTGGYTVLSHLPGLAIPVCILGCIFFVLSLLLIYKIVKWVKEDEYRPDEGDVSKILTMILTMIRSKHLILRCYKTLFN